MLEWFETAVEPHWPFMMAAVVFMVIGQVMKRSVFTRERAYAQYVDELPHHMSHLPGQPRVLRKARWFWWWGYKTMPLHPVIAGAILGYFVTPETGIEGNEAALYFAGAGACSVFLYQVLKGLLRRRNIELPALPGQSGYPEKPQVPPTIPPEARS